MERKDYERDIFAMLFKTSNGLQVYLDRMLKNDGLTGKQMFLMIVISSFKEHAPTLKEVAEKSSSSYQNVKQLALKLEKEAYVKIESDDRDKRKKKLILTEKALSYWQERENHDLHEMERLFKDCSNEDLKTFLKVVEQIQGNLDHM